MEDEGVSELALWPRSVIASRRFARNSMLRARARPSFFVAFSCWSSSSVAWASYRFSCLCRPTIIAAFPA